MNPTTKQAKRLRRATIQLTVLVVAAFLVRLLATEFILGGLNREYEGDEGAYVSLAINLAEGRGYVDQAGNETSYRVPGLPLLVAGLVTFTAGSMTGNRVFMCFLGALLVLACYLLGRSATGSHSVGWAVAILAVFFPTWVIASGFVHTEIPAAILLILTVVVLIEGYRRQETAWFILAGMFWGVAILTRPVALSYGPAIFIWLLLAMPGWRRCMVSIGAVIIVAGWILAPWALRNGHVQGRFILTSTQSGLEFYKGNNPAATGILAVDHDRFDESLTYRYPKEQYGEAARSEMFRADAISFIIENPFRFAELCMVRFVQLWKLYSPRVPLTHSLLVMASLGIAIPFFVVQIIRRGWKPGPEMLLLLIILCHTAVHVVFTANVRYRIPIEPLVVILAIQGFGWTFASVPTLATFKDKLSTAFDLKLT